MVLAMTAAGSSGSTRAQLLTYLKSKRVEELNSFFSQSARWAPSGHQQRALGRSDQSLSLKPAFRDIVHNSFKAVAEHADFQNQAEKAREEVNEWCNKETKGLIKEILPPDSVDEDTRLILANAVYFKGEWADEFDPGLTRDRKFYLLDGTILGVPSMSSWKSQSKLPYKHDKDNRRFSMYIYLPDARDGLPSLMERICSKPGFINRHLPHEMEELDAFRIPKFKIAFEFEASGVMEELGVQDLSGLSEIWWNMMVASLSPFRGYCTRRLWR